MERLKHNTVRDREVSKVVEHIFQNAFGNPIVFQETPTLSKMKANTWGIKDTDLYIKFANGSGIKISGTELT